MLCSRCKDRLVSFPSEAIPMRLNCEHLFCTKCYETLIEINGCCPVCEGKVTPAVGSNIKNLMEVRITEESMDFRDVIFEINEQDLKLLLKSIDQDLSSLAEVSYIAERLNDGGDTEEKIRQQRYSFDDNYKKFKSLGEKFCSTNFYHFDLKPYGKNCDAIFDKIMKKLSEGEKLYAAATINDKRKYGKVTLFHGVYVMINSLSLETIENGASFFWLHTFKSSFRQYLRSFLTFPSNEATIDGNKYTMIFDIFESHKRSGFVELCTGEAGYCFKDSDYTKKEEHKFEINFPGYKILHSADDGIKLKKGETVLSFTNTTLEIRKARNSDVPDRNIIGKLSHDVNFSALLPAKPSERKIKECGIVVFRHHISRPLTNRN